MKDKQRLVDYVNTCTAIAGSGNCLIGPYRPHGFVRLGPDCLGLQGGNGYLQGQPILRFSHTHVAGTGGEPRYGNIGVTPFCGKVAKRNIPPYICPPLDRVIDAIPYNEVTQVGYYSVNLRPSGILCELTCTKHVGVHRYIFQGDKESSIFLDSSAALMSGSKPGSVSITQEWESSQGSTGGYLQIISNREIIGRSDIRGGWGNDKSYSIYFYYQSDAPFEEICLASDGGMIPAKEDTEIIGSGIKCSLSYKNAREVNLKVGVSFVSVANARSFVEKETLDKSFQDIQRECEDEWELILSSFNISGGTEENKITFYSLLYRIFCMPTDLGVDEENPYWKSGVRQFTDYYCLWDSVRNANSFFNMFYPSLSKDILNSLLDIADHTGWLPDAYIANQMAYMQSACAADILFWEAASKGIKGVDYQKALKYMKKNNECTSPDPLVKGRYIEDYNSLGFLSTNITKGSVSRHIEYTYHDWCISQLANLLGDNDTASTYEENSKRIWNLWRDETKTFFPRHPDGSWLENYDPWHEAEESWNDASCYEGTTAVWSLNVFQNFIGLIERVGGNQAFIAMLNRVFEKGLFHIKETRMHIPHLYTYAGRPDIAAEKVLENLKTFSATPTGLTDNEDMGCQSGYFLWQSMGLYPIYGQKHYMLTPPIFDYIEAVLGESKLIITAERKGEGKYIQNCLLGNKAINRAWVFHDELMKSKKLHFILGDTPSDWGKNNPPPSI